MWRQKRASKNGIHLRAKHFREIMSFHPHNNLMNCILICPHFPDKTLEEDVISVHCPRSLGRHMKDAGLKLKQSDPRALAFPVISSAGPSYL